MNTTQTYLDNLKKQIHLAEMDCLLIEARENSAIEQLIVYLGPDYKNRERLLSVQIQQQELGQSLPGAQAEQLPYFYIQFKTQFPFPVKEVSLAQIASLMVFLNRLTQLPGFEMNEVENSVSFRYIHLTTEVEPNPKLCLSIIGNIMLLIDLYGETIEKVAIGQMSFNELLQQIVDLSKQLR